MVRDDELRVTCDGFLDDGLRYLQRNHHRVHLFGRAPNLEPDVVAGQREIRRGNFLDDLDNVRNLHVRFPRYEDKVASW